MSNIRTLARVLEEHDPFEAMIGVTCPCTPWTDDDLGDVPTVPERTEAEHLARVALDWMRGDIR